MAITYIALIDRKTEKPSVNQRVWIIDEYRKRAVAATVIAPGAQESEVLVIQHLEAKLKPQPYNEDNSNLRPWQEGDGLNPIANLT